MELATVLRGSTALGICCARSVQGSRSTDIQRLEGRNGRRGSTQKTWHVASHSDSRDRKSHCFIRRCMNRSRESQAREGRRLD